jgi:hypothetical protein
MEFVRVTSGRHPFEVVLLVAGPTVGVILLVSGKQPAAVNAAMSPLVRVVWVAMLLLAGIAGLTGVFWSGRLQMSLSIEAAGMLVLGSATSMYAIAVAARSGLTGAAAAGFTAAVAAGSWWRIIQIFRDLRIIDRVIQARTVTATVDEPAPVKQGDSHE